MNQAKATTISYMSFEKMADRQEFLNAMRHVGNSVSVVTTDGAAGRHGGTVSSFCSVSADPPTMLVCLNRDSNISRLVEANGCFNINILPAGAESLSNRFAGAQDKQLEGNLEGRFEDIEFTNNECGPAIAGATVLSCHVDEILLSGSHIIVTGFVSNALPSGKMPLAYLDGKYHNLVPVKGELK